MQDFLRWRNSFSSFLKKKGFLITKWESSFRAMAMITYQTSGCSSFTIRTWPCSREVKLKHVVDFQLLRRTHNFSSLKHCFHCRGRLIIFPKEKHFKVFSFKGNDQADMANVVEDDSKCSKKQSQLPISIQEREEAETSVSSSIPSASVNGEKSQIMEREKSNSVLLWFMGLDAALKIPLLVFIPWYFIFRMTYGIEVTRELTPLWIMGPLITSLYIKIIQGILSLYAFSFKKAIYLLQNLPSYYTLVNSYLMQGKLREILYLRLLKPISDIKNADYKALSKERMKQLREWSVEIYLDFVESIWPFYCRTIRFLKKANLL